MSASPQISVVTPSYNQVEWLGLGTASVADQENVDYEHIIQDGGTNGIREILQREFEKSLDAQRLRIFVEKDSGMYDALNRGLRRARGEICAHLNCDEQYLPYTLQRITTFFAAHPEIDIVFGDALVISPAGEPITYRRAICPTANHIRLSHLNTYTCSTFFRRRLLEQGHWLDPKWKSIGDAIWIYGMLKAGLKIAIYPHLLSVFALTGANLSTHNPISSHEKREWLKEIGAPWPALRPWHVGMHRLRKLFAGAYARRTFDYDIYTLSSPARRVRFAAKSLGGTWKLN